MKESIFRKKSLEQINSPENLSEYIRVSNPTVWLLLLSVILLLCGILVWGIFGRIYSTVSGSARVENGAVTCTFEMEQDQPVQVGMTVKINGTKGTLTGVEVGGENSVVFDAETETPLDDGVYSAKLFVESIRPLDFILD